MLKRIISGGQTGADQAALDCAKDYQMPTGGTAAKGWQTENGPAPWLAEKYGLIECRRPGYPPRTEQNIRDADATILFGNMNSRGSLLAIKTAKRLGKTLLKNPTAEEIVQLVEGGAEVINVGGNRASSNPGVYAATYATLGRAIELLRSAVEVG